MKVEWDGIFPAVTTKFTANDELDLEMFKTTQARWQHRRHALQFRKTNRRAQ